MPSNCETFLEVNDHLCFAQFLLELRRLLAHNGILNRELILDLRLWSTCLGSDSGNRGFSNSFAPDVYVRGVEPLTANNLADWYDSGIYLSQNTSLVLCSGGPSLRSLQTSRFGGMAGGPAAGPAPLRSAPPRSARQRFFPKPWTCDPLGCLF